MLKQEKRRFIKGKKKLLKSKYRNFRMFTFFLSIMQIIAMMNNVFISQPVSMSHLFF